MELIATIILIIVLFVIPKHSVNSRLENYDMKKVSMGKMAMDSHLSPAQKRANTVAGKYDKDDTWKI